MSGEPGYSVIAAESAVIVEARSSIGRLVFATTEVSGSFHGHFEDDDVTVSPDDGTYLSLQVSSLSAGKALYDAELCSRLEAVRYPKITARLRSAQPLGQGRYAAIGDLTIHGTTREQSCTIELDLQSQSRGRASAVGTLVIDIRDYDIPLPSVLMLQIYPEVSVTFRATVGLDSALVSGKVSS